MADVDESPEEGESPSEMVLRLASLKARAVMRNSGEVILAADTVVVISGRALGKPDTVGEATEMLSALSGQTHSVLTGWSVLGDGDERFGVSETHVAFRDLSIDEISSYIEDTQPFDKAGAYAIQGDNGRLIEQVEGSRANVMGLPLREISEALSELGVERSSPNS